MQLVCDYYLEFIIKTQILIQLEMGSYIQSAAVAKTSYSLSIV